jgi:hypothetical protein
MITPNRGADLRASWGALVEASLEAGRPPLFQLGAGLSLLENLPPLVALHAFSQERQDVATPTAVIGGQAVLWLTALMHESPANRSPATAINVIYGGPDVATQMASLAALAPGAQGDTIPAGYVSLLAPAAQAGTPLWVTLPFQLAEQTSPIQATEPEVADQLLAWAGVGLALLLILLALVL